MLSVITRIDNEEKVIKFILKKNAIPHT